MASMTATSANGGAMSKYYANKLSDLTTVSYLTYQPTNIISLSLLNFMTNHHIKSNYITT